MGFRTSVTRAWPKALHLATVCLTLALVSLMAGGCTSEGTAEDIAAIDIASAEARVWNPDSQHTVVHPIDLSDLSQVQELLDAWASLDGASGLERGLSPQHDDVVLAVDLKDGRHVELKWNRSWSRLRADYLERSAWGGNVDVENNVGMRSAKMIACFKVWMAKTGLELPLPVTEGPPEGWTTICFGERLHLRDFPQIKGDYVMWSDWDGNDLELFAYNVNTGLTTQVTDNNVDDHDLCLDGQYVAWLVDIPGSMPHTVDHEDIFWHDLATGETVQVTNDECWKQPPQVSRGRVVWQASQASDTVPGPWLFDVFLYEPETGTTTVLDKEVPRDEMFEFTDPQIADDLVVWVAPAPGGTDMEVFLRRISKNTTERLTDDAAEASQARVGTEAVAWLDDHNEVKVLDLTSGKTRTHASVSEAPLLAFDERVFVLSTSPPGGGPHAFALDLDTGQETAIPPSVTGYDDGLAVGTFYAEDGSTQVWLFDGDTGTQVNLSGRPGANCLVSPVSGGRVAWVVSESKGLSAAVDIFLSSPR